MNRKSLWALMALVSSLFAAVGVLRFVVDLWNYLHASGAGAAGTTTPQLNYRGIGAVLGGVVMFALFILPYRRGRY